MINFIIKKDFEHTLGKGCLPLISEPGNGSTGKDLDSGSFGSYSTFDL